MINFAGFEVRERLHHGINFAGFEVRERLHHGRGGRAWHRLLHSCKDEAEEGGGCGLKEG